MKAKLISAAPKTSPKLEVRVHPKVVEEANRRKLEEGDIGPVQYSGPYFENAWKVPEGARWVVVWTQGTSFSLKFSKEEPYK